MSTLLKRIVLHGVLTASLLGLVGLGFAELAGIWLAGQPVNRGPGVAPAPSAGSPIDDALRNRIPVLMAAWGFAFVAVGEVVLHLWRKRRQVPLAKPPAELKPDTAEVLLEELLRQVEAQREKPPEPAPSPSAPAAENSPTPEPVPGERRA